jgi:sugar phosphate isomerase/epimerase
VNPERIVSVSTAPYDGYELPQAFDSIAGLGATHADPAFLAAGEPAEAMFNAAGARRLAAWLRAAGLSPAAVYADLDLSGPDAPGGLRRRIDFAAAAGARYLVVPAPPRRDQRRALAHLQALAGPRAGPAVDLLLTPSAAAGPQALPDAAALVARSGLGWLGLSFSTVQAALAQPGLSAADQLDAVQPACRHLQLADLRERDGWFCVPPGQGTGACADVLRGKASRGLPVSLHLPLRLHRSRTGDLRRGPYRVPLADIEAAVTAGLGFVSSFH